MTPTLFVLGGPLKGAIIGLEEGATSVGRESSNRLYILDSLLSRRHCEFVRRGAAIEVTDLASLNGVFVNGVAVKQHALQEGDEIQIGDTKLFFSTKVADEPVAPALGRVEECQTIGETTIELPAEHGLYRRPERIVSGLDERQAIGAMAAWLKLSDAVVSIRETQALKHRVVSIVAELVGADRGALLPTEARPDFGPVAIWDGSGRTPFPVDSGLARRVEREGVALIVNDPANRDAVSVLCAPVPLLDEVVGVIYLLRTGAPFERHELTLATAAAGLAGMALDNVRRAEHFEREQERFAAALNADRNLVGDGAAMREVGWVIARAAPSEATVLILGESGTGKELAARAIHARSRRAKRSFTAVNCATFSESLLESELFGHERGAFSGAVVEKKGLLELAEGGTVFLDEVGELLPGVQARLLRVLQEREFLRVGGTKPIKVDVRLIAATNRNLKEAVAIKTFREDLFFRLNVIAMTMPPLRDRRDDIELLARHFVQKHAGKCGRRILGIAPDALRALSEYDWPGNVRELENAIEHAIVLGSTDELLIEDLPESILETASMSGQKSMLLDALKAEKTELVMNALTQARGDFAEAARLLGVHVNSLHRMIRNLGLKDASRAVRDRKNSV